MRRCPHCQAPNPSRALFCQRCGLAMAPVQSERFWAWSDWFEPAALRSSWLPLLAILGFRLSCGAWLTVGALRVEWHFLAFHLLHGLLFGVGLAWANGDLARGKSLRWILLGLAAGLFTEALEFWFTYQHVMQLIAFKVVEWFGSLNDAAMVPYRSLQALRLAGIVLPLAIGWWRWMRPRAAQVLAAFLWILAALGLRAFVIGFPLNWGGIHVWLGQKNLILYAFSALLALYALGAREKAVNRLTAG